MKNSKVTMQNIADKLGITKVSVSKALNNQPGIGTELKQKILEVANDLGYFNEKKTHNSKIEKFAFMVPKRFFLENENFYTTIFYYLNKLCILKNINLSLFVVNAEEEKKLSIPPILNRENFDGLFLAGEIDEAYVHAITNINLPTVSIDFYKPHMQVDCIITDNFYLGYSAAMYLIENGHSKIGFVGNPKQTSSIMDRFFGYQKSLSTCNINYSDEWNIVNNDPVTGYYYLDFDLPSDIPTAFVCHCDMAAYFLLQKVQSLGLNIPDDVSLISFDNTEMSKLCSPPLTTVDINKREFAEKAFEQMLIRIQNPQLPPQRIYINTETIIRNSVRKI